MRKIPIILLTTLATSLTAHSQVQDPTRPPSPAEIEAWFGNSAQDKASAPYQLQSILLSPDRRIAIIDGQRLRVGEQLENASVRAIEAGRVVLDRNGERIELTIDSHLTNNIEGPQD